MILATAPLRLSLGGGGTDLPAYASRFGGFVVSAAIDRFVHVVVNPRFQRSVRIAYARTEIVARSADVEHPIVREALAATGIESSIEVVSIADLPANSGLGSSSTFTVALLAALRAHRGESPTPRALAEEACAIEIDRLGEPIGRQDQFVAAFGGVVAMTFGPGAEVGVEKVVAPPGTLERLASALFLVHTGIERPARVVLAEQGRAIAHDEQALLAMRRIEGIGREVARSLGRGDVDAYGEILHEHWEHKRRTTSAMSDPAIDALYDEGRRAGATGGKLVGAGGGGFVLFHVPEPRREAFLAAMRERERRVLAVRFEAEGVRIAARQERKGPDDE